MQVQDVGFLEYRAAWRLQEQSHAQVVVGGEEQLLLVEHPPVITLGRRPGLQQHILVPSEELRRREVQVVESDRGGDITFHGHGQLVAYPIIRLADHGLSVSGYVHQLEKILIALLADFGVEAFTDPKAIGAWVRSPGGTSGAEAKIAAIGVRIRRGVSLHGLALNVETDLSYFDLIVPCGLENRQVTSLKKLLPENSPTLATVKERLSQRMVETFSQSSNDSMLQ